VLQEERSKVLILTGQTGAHGPIVDALRQHADVTETSTIDQAINALRSEHFSAVFSDAGDFLPLERALVSQQANLILNTIGEGVCIVDGEGRCNWMNKKMAAWPARVHEKIRRTCQEAFQLFSTQVSPQPTNDTPAGFNRSKRYALNIEDQQFLEMIASPSPRRSSAPTGRWSRWSRSYGMRQGRGGCNKRLTQSTRRAANWSALSLMR
jgi:hypothetical protein